MDALNNCCASLWVMAFSLDLPEIVAGLIEAHQAGVSVRVIFDLEQASRYGTKMAMKTLVAEGVPVRYVQGKWIKYVKDTEMYVVVEEQDREYTAADQTYRSNQHYKYMLVDCEDPNSQDVKRGWSFTTEPDSCGVVTGSFNPTKFSQASAA